MKTNTLTVCIDANVYISAIAFDGKPLRILELALDKKFYLVTSSAILNEVKRNLINKLGHSESKIDELLNQIIDVATVYEPTGAVQFINHKQDNLVLETALLGSADILLRVIKKICFP